MRDLCNKCTRPIDLCYCKSIKEVHPQTKIILLTHPLEVKHPFNTGRIVELSFKGTQNFIGEDFNDHIELKKS